MAAVANIVLADALGTPVNHTFIPLGPDSQGVWWWEDQSQASAIGYWRISLSTSFLSVAKPGESSSGRTNRIKISLHEPVLETVANNSAGLTPAPTVAFVPRVNCEYIMSERTSLQQRMDLRKMFYNLQNNAQIVSAVETLQNVY